MRWKRFLLRQRSGEDGIAAVEFVLISLPIFLLLLCIADFGDAWLRKQVITAAAREGARYGAVYASPKPTEAQIQTFVSNYLTGFGITPDTVNAPAAGGATGTALTVTVQATKTWFVLDFILDPTQITATSTMRNE